MANKRVEKRHDDRREFDILVSYSAEGISENNFTYNLSEGGMFIETTLPQEIDTRLRINFEFPMSRRTIEVLGRVAWVRKESGGPTMPAGMGVEFLELNDDLKHILADAMNIIEKAASGE